jgi:CheY-like chemotaxis protein
MVLLDLMMPVMDGWQMLAQLRADQSISGVSVIVTSAAPSGDLSGVTHVLRKPYSLEGLLELVKKHCETFGDP